VLLLFLLASAFLQILLLRLFPALLLLYFLSVPVTVTQEEVWSAAGAPEHAAIDIAITTASIPFIILLILIIVSPL